MQSIMTAEGKHPKVLDKAEIRVLAHPSPVLALNAGSKCSNTRIMFPIGNEISPLFFYNNSPAMLL